jgi:hypothetical protein
MPFLATKPTTAIPERTTRIHEESTSPCRAVGIAVACSRCLETDKARAQRAQRTKEKEVRALADRISSHGRKVHRHYPTGDVVVGESDLAAQLRKRPDVVSIALNLLLGEQKVQKAHSVDIGS